MDLFLRLPKSKFFAWIHFRGRSNFSNFAWNNFCGRQNFYLKKFHVIVCVIEKTKRSRHENSIYFYRVNRIYIFFYNKYYACDFRKIFALSCSFLRMLDVYWASKLRKPKRRKKKPKRRKVTEKKPPLPKIMDIKTMFTKILSHQETNEEIEIDSDWCKLI